MMNNNDILNKLKEAYMLRSMLKNRNLIVQDELKNEIYNLEQSYITGKVIPELEKYANTLLKDLECEMCLAILQDANGDVRVENEYVNRIHNNVPESTLEEADVVSEDETEYVDVQKVIQQSSYTAEEEFHADVDTVIENETATQQEESEGLEELIMNAGKAVCDQELLDEVQKIYPDTSLAQIKNLLSNDPEVKHEKGCWVAKTQQSLTVDIQGGKETIVPHLFEVECPPEKRRVLEGKTPTWQNLQLKYLVNKETGAKSIKYLSVVWDLRSESSKTVVLKLPSTKRGNFKYNPLVLWNYETGEVFSKYGTTEFLKITKEATDTNYRTLYRIFHDFFTFDVRTGEELSCINGKNKDNPKERAIPIVTEDGHLVWKISASASDSDELKRLPTYHLVEIEDINGVYLWKVKYRTDDDWCLLYNGEIIAKSKTGVFVKKGRVVFGQIENDRYKLYNIFTGVTNEEEEVTLTQKGYVLGDGKEVPFRDTSVYWSNVLGVIDSKYYKVENNKAVPVISPEEKYDRLENVSLKVSDQSFVVERDYKDWGRRFYPKGKISHFVVINILPCNYTNYTLLKDQNTGAEIVVYSTYSVFSKDQNVYLKAIRNVTVCSVEKDSESQRLSHRPIVYMGSFLQVNVEEYEDQQLRLQNNPKLRK